MIENEHDFSSHLLFFAMKCVSRDVITINLARVICNLTNHRGINNSMRQPKSKFICFIFICEIEFLLNHDSLIAKCIVLYWKWHCLNGNNFSYFCCEIHLMHDVTTYYQHGLTLFYEKEFILVYFNTQYNLHQLLQPTFSLSSCFQLASLLL